MGSPFTPFTETLLFWDKCLFYFIIVPNKITILAKTAKRKLDLEKYLSKNEFQNEGAVLKSRLSYIQLSVAIEKASCAHTQMSCKPKKHQGWVRGIEKNSFSV